MRELEKKAEPEREVRESEAKKDQTVRRGCGKKKKEKKVIKSNGRESCVGIKPR